MWTTRRTWKFDVFFFEAQSFQVRTGLISCWFHWRTWVQGMRKGSWTCDVGMCKLIWAFPARMSTFSGYQSHLCLASATSKSHQTVEKVIILCFTLWLDVCGTARFIDDLVDILDKHDANCGRVRHQSIINTQAFGISRTDPVCKHSSWWDMI